jgi:inhibitor of KinA
MGPQPRIFPLSDRALTIEFGREISDELNSAAIALCRRLQADPFPGLDEAVPAIASATIFYDPVIVRRHTVAGSAFAAVRDAVLNALTECSGPQTEETRTITVPVSFRAEDALDLPFICQAAGLDADDVIGIFLSRAYRVYMLGFLPGFAYMGAVDGRIAVPRHETPRLKVPKGSVGIAGGQTGIYPAASPGGWRIIGRTDLELLRPDEHEPSVFRPGDSVRFVRSD